MKSQNNRCNDIYKEVIIIGNGPSGIALSYLLSGWLPFLINDSHPDEMLSKRLESHVGQCLISKNLYLLADGLEGRSTNPISLLIDCLLYPYADVGLELDPLIQFRKNGVEIDHLVLGKGPPGGSWHRMDPNILTLSLGSWMALPGLPFKYKDSSENRAFASNVANYYVEYVKKLQLELFFLNNRMVTNVTILKNEKKSEWINKINVSERVKLCIEPKSEDRKSCILSNAINYILRNSKHNKTIQNHNWKKRSKDQQHTILNCRKISNSSNISNCDSSNNTNICDNFKLNNTINLERVPSPSCDSDKNWLIDSINIDTGEKIRYTCKYLILANGANDLPNKLNNIYQVDTPDWLYHDLRQLEHDLDNKDNQQQITDPVIVVGAGLSAADAIIAIRSRNIPVIHVFRNKYSDLNKQLPENMYPEYHKVHQMMLDGGSTYSNYKAYSECELSSLNSNDHSVLLISKNGDNIKLQVSFVIVLIGSRPDLTFFPYYTSIGVKKDYLLDIKNNPIDIDKNTHEVKNYRNLFAVGPLAGDNFVRFIMGGALAVVSEIYKRKNLL